MKQRLIAMSQDKQLLKDATRARNKMSPTVEDYKDLAEQHRVYRSIINKEPKAFSKNERDQAQALRDAVRKKLHAALHAHTRANPPGGSLASETFLTNVPQNYFD